MRACAVTQRCRVRRLVTHARDGGSRVAATACWPRQREYTTTQHFDTPTASPATAAALVASQRARPRASRRRYASDNTQGRSRGVRELIDQLKSLPQGEATAFFDTLPPRDRLDILRTLHTRRARRTRATAVSASSTTTTPSEDGKDAPSSSSLPLYRSALFARRYCFREEDVHEQFTLGRGPGGQATNRRMQTVIILHRPTGVRVKYSRFPSLWLNRNAARALLHLRVEHALLGEQSTMSRAAALRARRAAAQRAARQRLAADGDALRARRAHSRCVYAVQTGATCLPPAVMRELTSSSAAAMANATSLSLASLFDEQCRNLWPMLTAAVAHASAAAAAAATTTTCADDGDSTARVAVPELLRYVFPAPDYDNDDDDDETRQQLQRCVGDARVCDNVRRALSCIAELFGLRLTTRPASAPPRRNDNNNNNTDNNSSSSCEGATTRAVPALVLVRDGANWRELRSRMVHTSSSSSDRITTTTTTLTPLARVVWPWVYRSLRTLHMRDEAAAVRGFFAREAKRGDKKVTAAVVGARDDGSTAATVPPPDEQTAWARDALAALHAAAPTTRRASDAPA